MLTNLCVTNTIRAQDTGSHQPEDVNRPPPRGKLEPYDTANGGVVKQMLTISQKLIASDRCWNYISTFNHTVIKHGQAPNSREELPHLPHNFCKIASGNLATFSHPCCLALVPLHSMITFFFIVSPKYHKFPESQWEGPTTMTTSPKRTVFIANHLCLKCWHSSPWQHSYKGFVKPPSPC